MGVTWRCFTVALACFSSAAAAAELTADQPGVMCASAAALAQLTLPGGDSRTHRPGASPAELTAAQQGGCVDIPHGLSVTVLQHHQNTSVVSYADQTGALHTMVVPNADFRDADAATPPNIRPAQSADASAPPVGQAASVTPLTAGPGRTEDPFHAPRLTDIITALAYGKMTDTPPDFRAYAEQAAPYQNASAFQKDAVLHHLTDGFRAQYAALSLSSLYTLRVNTELRQYDGDRGGYPLSFTDTEEVRVNDPVHTSVSTYNISFININAYNFIPIIDKEAAQDFAARYGFNTHAENAADVMLEIAFQLVDAPPVADSQTAVIRARILKGRILSRQGQILHVFPSDQAVLSAMTTPGAALGPHLDTLKATAVQDVQIGMPQAEAAAAARAAHPDAARDSAPSYDAYFDSIRGSANGLDCGGISAPPASNGLVSWSGGTSTLGSGAPAPYSSCLAFGITDGAVSEVHSVQFQSGTTAEALVQVLDSHYGPPTGKTKDPYGTYTERWIGKDAAGRTVEIIAEVDHRSQGPFHLEVDLRPWKDPRPTTVQATTSGPRL